MLKKKHKNQNLRQQKKSSKPEFLSFAEHLNELRRRLFYVAGAVAVFSTAAYFVQQQLVHWLLLPAHGVQFIYTSPGGGISFLFSVCTYVGIVLSIPVIIYNIVAFIEPVMKAVSKKLVVRLSIASGVLAITGMALGYKFGLPLALHFLTHQFTTKQIKPLFTIQEYMSFVTIYMIGAALMFQVPLILLFINHIKPLKPSKLLHYERHVVVFAFIVSAVMAPTINLIDQLVIAIPIMIIYQVAIVLVWYANRNRLSAVAVATPLPPILKESRPPSRIMSHGVKPMIQATQISRPSKSIGAGRSVHAIKKPMPRKPPYRLSIDGIIPG